MAKERKFQHLSANFLRGNFPGQLKSVHANRDDKPEKLAEYKRALADGDCVIPETITRAQSKKLQEMGIEIPENVTIAASARKPKEAATEQEPAQAAAPAQEPAAEAPQGAPPQPPVSI